MNAALTVIGWLESLHRIRHSAAMERTPKAGGFFLVAAILLGFVAGLATRDAMRGVIIGTAIGVLIAIAVWLLDRRR